VQSNNNLDQRLGISSATSEAEVTALSAKRCCRDWWADRDNIAVSKRPRHGYDPVHTTGHTLRKIDAQSAGQKERGRYCQKKDAC